MSDDMTTVIKDRSETRLGPYDLFDRVINVRLRAVDRDGRREDLVIRSDWEPVYGSYKGMRTMGFRKCVHKPSISFKYKQVSRDTDIKISLYITNFVMFTADGNMITSFSANDYRLEMMEVTLGYFGQCRQSPPETWSEFMDIEPLPGMDMKRCDTITAVYTSKLPPDLTLQIEAACANSLAVPEDESEDETAGRRLDELESAGYVKKAEGSLLDVMERNVLVYYGPKVWSADGSAVAETERYKVFATDRVRGIEFQPLTDASGAAVPPLLKDDQGNGLTVGQALTAFLQSAGVTDIQFKLLDGGRIFFYMREDLDDPSTLVKFFQDSYKESAFELYYGGKLPAVKSIVVNETATVVCPFFAFIGPFQRFKFENRYSISTMVEYWARQPDEDRSTFYPISVEVSFSTTKGDNEMQMYCVRERGNIKV